MAEQPTIGDLVKENTLSDDAVSAAVDAYMADPATTLFAFGESHELDLAVAISSNRWASDVLADSSASDGLKRSAVRTAIWLARPEKR
ncbi:hypothetical protein [Methylobacterium segetis]|uniref:hypothetical protein n=1 Tax=Methylobacterium segetis TaxID=2488750 RepID=UPI001044B395|nr:hypothetical protein [Methylobacterium segetis]